MVLKNLSFSSSFKNHPPRGRGDPKEGGRYVLRTYVIYLMIWGTPTKYMSIYLRIYLPFRERYILRYIRIQIDEGYNYTLHLFVSMYIGVVRRTTPMNI